MWERADKLNKHGVYLIAHNNQERIKNDAQTTKVVYSAGVSSNLPIQAKIVTAHSILRD